MDSDDIDALLAVAESQGLAYDFGESDEDGAEVTGTGAAAAGDGVNKNGNSPPGAAPATGPGRRESSGDDQPPTQSLLSQRTSNLKKEAAESARTAVKEREARPVQTPVKKRSLPRERVNLDYVSDDEIDVRPSRRTNMAAFRTTPMDTPPSPPPPPPPPRTPGVSDGIGTPSSVEEFSGLNIRNRLISALALKTRLCDMRVIKLQALKTVWLDADVSKSEWATVGIVSRKTKARESGGGGAYALWHIATLGDRRKRGGAEQCTLFVFGGAFSEHFRIEEGTVVAVIKAAVMRGKSDNASHLKVFREDQIVPIGSSTDFGICSGLSNTNTRGICGAIVDKRVSEYCGEHMEEASRNLQSLRGELGGGYLANSFLYTHKRSRSVLDEADVGSKAGGAPTKVASAKELNRMLLDPEALNLNPNSQGMRLLMMASGKKPPDIATDVQDENGVTVKRFRLGAMKGSTRLATNVLKPHPLNTPQVANPPAPLQGNPIPPTPSPSRSAGMKGHPPSASQKCGGAESADKGGEKGEGLKKVGGALARAIARAKGGMPVAEKANSRKPALVAPSSGGTSPILQGAPVAKSGKSSESPDSGMTNGGTRTASPETSRKDESGGTSGMRSGGGIPSPQSVAAWFCHSCETTVERRSKECVERGHESERVMDAVKRFFRCAKCGAIATTIDERLMKRPCVACKGIVYVSGPPK